MDIGATLFSTGWASGVNAYATVALLGILGRTGAAEVPEPLTGNLVIAVAVAMFAVEFVTDKVAYVDSAWDTVHTIVRPAIGAWSGGADRRRRRRHGPGAGRAQRSGAPPSPATGSRPACGS